MIRLLEFLARRYLAKPFLSTVSGVLGIVNTVSGLMSDDSSSASSSADASSRASAKYYDQMATIAGEQWDLYKKFGPAILDWMNANSRTNDRTAEEIALAAGDVKDAFANSRASLKRAIGATRNPGDPGFGALLAPSYMDEGAKVAAAVTAARRAERARVEGTNWDRKLQTLQAVQGIPQQANAALSAAAANATGNTRALTQLASFGDDRATRQVYGGLNLATRAFGRTNPGSAGPAGGGAWPDDYGVSNFDPYAGSGVTNASDYAASLGDFNFKDGGAIRGRRYADGGRVRNRTKLADDAEAEFMSGYQKWAEENGIDPNPDNPEHKYDLRGAWASGFRPEKGGHWPSRFKDFDHPNRYVRTTDGVLDTITGKIVEEAGFARGGPVGDEGRDYAGGGVIHGRGTGTSDSITTRKRPGTFILSADTVRAIGTKKVRDLMEKAGVRPGEGGSADSDGPAINVSNGEAALPPEVVQHYGEEFFRKLQQKYHRPVAADGMANGGAIRRRGLPSSVEEAIFRAMPDRALGRRH